MWGYFTSCDMSYPLLVDGHRENKLSCNCGTLVLKGASGLSDWIELHFDGNYMVIPDSIVIDYPRKGTEFYFNDSLMDNCQPIQINGKNKLGIRLSVGHPIHWGRKGTIKLLPSNFILCDGIPVITDTILFRIKNQRERSE